MPDLTYAQLKGTWLRAARGTRYETNAWASLMAAIAEAESSGDPLAVNPDDNGGRQTSWGLWQISNGTHSEPARNWADPLENARLAIRKLDNPSPADAKTGPGGVVAGLGAWGTFDTGAYKAFLSDKTAADMSLVAGPDAVTTAAATQGASSGASCLWGFGGADLHNIGLGPIHGPSGVGAVCIISKSQARALLGVGLMGAGGLLALVGVNWLMVAAAAPTALRVASSVLVPEAAAAKGATAAKAPAPPAPPEPRPATRTARQAQPVRGEVISRRDEPRRRAISR